MGKQDYTTRFSPFAHCRTPWLAAEPRDASASLRSDVWKTVISHTSSIFKDFKGSHLLRCSKGFWEPLGTRDVLRSCKVGVPSGSLTTRGCLWSLRRERSHLEPTRGPALSPSVFRTERSGEGQDTPEAQGLGRLRQETRKFMVSLRYRESSHPIGSI